MNWEGLKKLFEKHPLPWDFFGGDIVDSSGNVVAQNGRRGGDPTVAWAMVSVINAAAKPEPPFVPGLYPYRYSGCAPSAEWCQSKEKYDGLRNQVGIKVGKRIEPEFQE